MVDIGASILARLKNKAKVSGISYQQCLQLFFQDYDIYYLARTFGFDGMKLQTAIFETLKKRGTPYEKDSFERIVQLADDADMQTKWKYFLKNMKDELLDFVIVIDEIKRFLEPVYDSLISEIEWKKIWDSTELVWKKDELSSSNQETDRLSE